MMSSKCLIEKGRWMLPQQCMIGKNNYKFAVIGYSYDPSDGCSSGRSASDQPMRGNEFGRQPIEVDKSDAIEMKQRNDVQMMFAKEDEILRCVEKLFDEPNAQRWPSQRCLASNQMESYGVNPSRAHLKSELNGNVSYSYRTHYFLNH